MTPNSRRVFTTDYSHMNPERIKQRDMTHAVYQFLDNKGNRLYIGVSIDFQNRRASHRRKEWWPLVAKTIVRYLPNKRRALDCERALIFQYQPKYNRGYALASPVVKGLQQPNDAIAMHENLLAENKNLQAELHRMREELAQTKERYRRVVGE